MDIPATQPNSRLVIWLLLSELIFMAVFAVLLHKIDTFVAVSFLLMPLQLLLLIVAAGRPAWLLYHVVALLPLPALELVPYRYVQLILYGAVPALFLLGYATRFLQGAPQHRRPLPRVFRVAVAVLLVAIVASAASALLRGWNSKWLMRYTFLYTVGMVYLFMSVEGPRDAGEVKRALMILLGGYTLVCALVPFFMSGIVGGPLGKTMLTSFGVINLNVLASHVGVATILALSLALDARSTLARVAFLAMLCLFVAVLVLSKSRGAWLGFGLAYLYVLFRTRSLTLAIAAGAIAVSVLSASALRALLLVRVEQTDLQDPSLWGRLLLWKYAWDIFRQNWLFGVGPENFRYVKHLYGFPWPRSYGTAFNTNSLFLEYLVDTGVFGLGAFLLLVGSSLRGLLRLKPQRGRGVSVGLGAAIVFILTHGALDCVTWQHGALMLMFVVVGWGSLPDESATRASHRPGVADARLLFHATAGNAGEFGRASAPRELARPAPSPFRQVGSNTGAVEDGLHSCRNPVRAKRIEDQGGISRDLGQA